MRSLRTTLGIAAIAGLAVAGSAVSAAQAGAPAGGSSTTVGPHIIGGTKATSTYIVQLSFEQGGNSYGCTGNAIAKNWVLTAKHCVSGSSSMNVYYGNSTSSPGTAYPAKAMYTSSATGDVALIELTSGKTLTSYGKLASSYTAKVNDTGTIWGYGLRADQVAADHLYKANVKVLGVGSDAYGGDAIHISGVTGGSNHGDSGGPLIIGGVIVGVDSKGDKIDPGDDINATSHYSNLSTHRSWITDTAGV